MTKEEAIAAMNEGKHITHNYFSKDEWVTANELGDIVTEEGYEITPELFWHDRREKCWNDGWFIHWTSPNATFSINHLQEVLDSGYKVTHPKIKFDWFCQKGEYFRCSNGELRNAKKEFETFKSMGLLNDWKIIKD